MATNRALAFATTTQESIPSGQSCSRVPDIQGKAPRYQHAGYGHQNLPCRDRERRHAAMQMQYINSETKHRSPLQYPHWLCDSCFIYALNYSQSLCGVDAVCRSVLKPPASMLTGIRMDRRILTAQDAHGRRAISFPPRFTKCTANPAMITLEQIGPNSCHWAVAQDHLTILKCATVAVYHANAV